MKVVPEACVFVPRETRLPSPEVRITDPTDALQVVFTIELAVKVTNVGSLSVYGPPLMVHPFASVTITEYKPATSPVGFCTFVPLLHT